MCVLRLSTRCSKLLKSVLKITRKVAQKLLKKSKSCFKISEILRSLCEYAKCNERVIGDDCKFTRLTRSLARSFHHITHT